MKARKQIFNNVTLINKTQWARDIIHKTIQHAENFKLDPQKKERYAMQECPVCYYYIGRCGGSACTDAHCSVCDKIMHFGNTCVDVLCVDCAKKYNVCHHCGGDIDAKHRRKQRFGIESEEE